MNIDRNKLRGLYGRLLALEETTVPNATTQVDAVSDFNNIISDIENVISEPMENLKFFGDAHIDSLNGSLWYPREKVLPKIKQAVKYLDGRFELEKCASTSADNTSFTDIKNPHKAYWRFLLLGIYQSIKNNKYISVIVSGLILAYIVYKFGWNK